MTYSRMQKNTLVYLVFILMLFHVIYARPSEEFQGFGPKADRCKLGDEYTVEVCQRCAKQTKSNIVYPMCCANEDDVFNWCDKYINYGRKTKRDIE